MASYQEGVKRWIFSGFSSTDDEQTAKKQIESLGGIVVDRDKYTFLCTHVLVKEFSATEKILAALAAGKWIVRANYVRDSYQHGHWRNEREYEIILHEKVCKYRRRHKDATSVGIYFGWTFYVCLGNKNMTRSVRRIIAAGDGEVVSNTELSKANVIISDKIIGIPAKAQLSLPIISFHYLKDTLILKRDPSLIKPYLLNNHRSNTLPKRVKEQSNIPVLIIEDAGETSTSKRPIVDLIDSPVKKLCARGNEKCVSSVGSLKQTRIEQFLKFHGSPDVTKSMPRGRTTSSSIEIVDVWDGIPDKADLSKGRKDDDCIITKVESVPGRSMRRVNRRLDVEILEEMSPKAEMETEDEVCVITNEILSTKERSSVCKEATQGGMANVQLVPDNKFIKEADPVSKVISSHSVKIPVVKAEPVTKFVRKPPVADGVACTNTSASESMNNSLVDLPDMSRLEDHHYSDGEADVVKSMLEIDERTHNIPANVINKGVEEVTNSENKVNSSAIVPLKTSMKSSPVLTKNDIEKLPKNVREILCRNTKPMRYSKEDMQGTVMKFIKSTKAVNRFNVSYSEHIESKLTQQVEDHTDRDNLNHLMNPASVFQRTTSVRELAPREVVYYEASTDEDTINCKMGDTEKGIIIMGIFSLQTFVTPFTYPPPSIFGHLLQKMIFEALFQLCYTRAIDIAYSILKYFPPLNLEMRKYYVKVFESAARHEKNFSDNLYLPWKFILRPIASLQANVSLTDDSSMSSSEENNNTVNMKANSLGLLEFILAVLSEDMKQPNHGEFLREHLAWQVFWGQSSDPTEITSPVKQLLRMWMSFTNASSCVRHCLAKLVAIVLELIWRFDRSLLLPISPLPCSLSNFAAFLLNRIAGCDSKTLMKLMCDLPSPWSRAIFGSIIFKRETQMNDQEITFEHILEFGFLVEDQGKTEETKAVSTNKDKQPVSPQKKLQKSVNKRGPKGETKLSQVCIKGNIDKMKELLAVPGIDINLPDYTGWTPLHEAAIRGRNDCVELLLKYDCLDSLDMKNTLHFYLKRTQSYLCNVVAQDEGGRTALHKAVEKDHLKTARILLEYGGDTLLNIKDRKGRRPFKFCQSSEMITLLKSYKGKTPSRGPQKNYRFRKSSSILHSALSNREASLLCYEDRKQFIISFTNYYLEATGIRFCRKDIMTETFKIYTDYLAQKQYLSLDSKTKNNVGQMSNSETLNGFKFENVKLTDAELEEFDLIYEGLNHNLVLCRDLTAEVKGATREPEFIIALRKLVL